MKIKQQNASVPRATRRHLFGTAAILVVLASAWGFGHFSIQKDRSEVLAEHAQSLDDLGKLTQKLFLTEEEKLDSLLLRVRSDLRADGHWSQQASSAAPKELGSEASPKPTVGSSATSVTGDEAPRPKEVAVQLGTDVTEDRWRPVRADLKRGLSARADLQSLELVVADQAGLTAIRVIKTEDRMTEEMEDPRASKGVAKAIWYADEVRRAVAANGRRTERGALFSTGTGQRASDQTTLRVALAMHDPSELVQGVLVATFDVSAIADTLTSVASSEIHSRLVTLDGRSLHTQTTSTPESATETAPAMKTDAERDAILASRITASDRTEKAFTADDSLVDGLSLVYADGRSSDAVLLMEIRLPPSGLISQASTSWGIGLIALTFLAALAITFLMLRRSRLQLTLDAEASVPRPNASVQEEKDVSEALEEAMVSPDLPASSVSEGEAALSLGREQINLREWLGDVRSCLEREAATRGLSLNLKCERSLPQSFEQDPGWLGGLVVAMGREALDATAEERVFVRVREDSHDVLRFEVDAGPIVLSPVQGMLAVAEELGGHFESDPDHGLALLLPLGAS